MMIPHPLSRLVRRMRVLFHRADVDREMADEIAMHLELEIEDRMRRGMPAEEARRTALVDFGGANRYREEGRAAYGVGLIDDLGQDMRYALRVLRNSPAFTLTSVITVSIGIAAMTAVLSAANAMLFRPPPVAHPERLVAVSEVWKGGDRSWETSMGQYMYRYAHFLDLRDATTGVFDGLTGYRYGSVALRTDAGARSIAAISVAPNYFDVLGVHPAQGRFFTASARSDDGDGEAVLSDEFWRREFNADPAALGRQIFVDGRSVVVIGVAPPAFTGTMIGLPADLWLPTHDGSLTMIGRLRPELSRERAAVALTVIGQNLAVDIPAQRVRRVVLDPLASLPVMARTPVMGFIGILIATAALMLLIVAANIAGIFLARGAQRRREIAVRLALGAARGRVIRQLLTESVALCLIGGGLGVVLALWLTRLTRAIDLPIGPRTSLDIHPDARVFLTAFGVSLVVAVVAGLTPAVQSTRVDLLSALRGLTGQRVRGGRRAHSGFVVVQLATALVLLLTTGLFVRAAQRGAHVDRGLDASNVVNAEVTVGATGYDRERGGQFYADLLTRLSARPEFVSVALGEWTPLAASNMGQGMTTNDGRHVPVTWGVATAGFTETMRIAVVAGRSFSASDTRTSTPVVVVNETLARQMWPGQSPLGQHLNLQGMREVVGVTHDGKYRRLDEPATAYALIPFTQRYSDRTTIYARQRDHSTDGIRVIREEVSRLDRNIALERAGRLEEQLDLYTMPQRAAAWCVGLFGLFGVVLAALGVYGVIAFSVAQRAKEIGIRIALGAQYQDILRELLWPGLQTMLTAIVVGVPIAFAIGLMSRRFLFDIAPLDGVTFVSVSLGLSAVALVANYLPVRRAARMDATVTLRVD
jgi:predicted permease